MKKTFDVTVSVWNTFWFRELIQGLSSAGFSVHSIGTNRAMQGSIKHTIVFPATIMLRLGLKLSSQKLIYSSQRIFDALTSACLGPTSAVWALSGTSSNICKKAKTLGLPVILDTGGVHKQHGYDRLLKEYKKLNLKYEEQSVLKHVNAAENEYRNADVIVCGSSFVKDSFIKHGIDGNKIIVNPYGVNTDLWKTARKHDKAIEPFVFIYTAGIIPRKGFHYLMEAWRMADFPNAELWVCGSGDPGFLKKCGPIPESVKFLGHQSHASMVPLFKKSHVYVLPSLLEGFARSVAEALVAGLPAIVTWETGLTDVVEHGENGWIVPSGDSAALADQLKWCQAHPKEVTAAGGEAEKLQDYLSFQAYGKRCVKILQSYLP